MTHENYGLFIGEDSFPKYIFFDKIPDTRGDPFKMQEEIRVIVFPES